METKLPPTVTVLITTRDRSDELRTTLRELRRQDYPSIELIVIDDCSEHSLEPLVKREWPGATVIRNKENLGYIVNRSLGMHLAVGEFIVSLDDDSCFTTSTDLSSAVAKMVASPKVGALAFLIHNGPLGKPVEDCQHLERHVQSFIGCGHLIRKAVADQVGDYCNFYRCYGEENEYALRVLDKGWNILFFPAVIVHHRVSKLGRLPARIWGYSLRNGIWTAILHLPARKMPVELLWKFSTGALDALRLLYVKWFVWVVFSTVYNTPKLLSLRKPISRDTLHLYECLRFGHSISPDSSAPISPITLRQRLRWAGTEWWNRRRARAFWDRRGGSLGRSSIAVFSDTASGRPGSARGR